jgi:hypothetical protein
MNDEPNLFLFIETNGSDKIKCQYALPSMKPLCSISKSLFSMSISLRKLYSAT